LRSSGTPSRRRQWIVSAQFDSFLMPEDIESLLRRLIGGDAQAPAAILDRATTSCSPALLVAAALLADEPDVLLARAAQHAGNLPGIANSSPSPRPTCTTTSCSTRSSATTWPTIRRACWPPGSRPSTTAKQNEHPRHRPLDGDVHRFPGGRFRRDAPGRPRRQPVDRRGWRADYRRDPRRCPGIRPEATRDVCLAMDLGKLRSA
jgi:hypothetical protein